MTAANTQGIRITHLELHGDQILPSREKDATCTPLWCPGLESGELLLLHGKEALMTEGGQVYALETATEQLAK